MKRTIFQHPTILDDKGNVVQQGTYSKESPLVNATNDGVLDYINNNLEALRDNINGSRIYVANKDALPAMGDLSAMYIAEDTGKWYLWDGTKYIETDNARKIADEALAARDAAKASQTAAADSARVNQADWNQTDDTQTDFIKNKPDVLLKSGGTVTGTIAAMAFSGHLTGDVTGTADKAVADGNGNNIANTYVTKSGLASSVTTDTGKVATLTATDSTLTNITVTGETSVPTANAGNSSKAIANTEFVAKSIAALVNGVPDQLNTLNELATALGNDSDFASTVTAELAKKLNSAEAENSYATKMEAGVPYQIKRNTTYKVGDVLTSPSLPPGCVIVVTQAGTTGSTEPDWTTIKSNIGG